MGKDIVIRGVTRQGIETFSAPISGGGTAVFRDTSGADAVAGDLAAGKTAYGAAGQIIGTKEPPSGSISITENGSVDVTDYATALVNVQSGGGGPTAADAILIVTVPAGSTVTAEKGSVTLVPTLWTAAADSSLEKALFVIEPEQFDSSTPWTVTATNGTDSASDTVTVDSNKQYDLELSYYLWLFKAGTGVLVSWTSVVQSSNVSIDTSLTTMMQINRTSQSNGTSKLYVSSVDFTNLVAVVVDMEIVNVYSSGSHNLNPILCVSDTLPSASIGGYPSRLSTLGKITFNDTSVRNTYSLDTSSITGSHPVGFFGNWGANIYNVYGVKA